MVAESQIQPRPGALRFCLLALGWMGAIFAWASLLTYDVADAPGTVVWPPADPIHNICGIVGSTLAHGALMYLGVGVFPALGLLTLGLLASSRGVRLNDLWLRGIGVLLVTVAAAAAGELVLSAAGSYPIFGPGGALGMATADFLLVRLHTFGTALLLTLALVVGLVLAADNLLLALPHWLRWVSTRSAPAMAHAGQAVAGLSQRLHGSEVAETATRRAARKAARQLELEDALDEPVDEVEDEGEAEAEEEPVDEEVWDEDEEYAYDDDEDDDEDEEEDGEEDEEDEEEEDEDKEDDGELSRAEAEEEDIPVGPPAVSKPVVKEVGPPPAPRPKPQPIRQIDDEGYELPPLDLLETPPELDRVAIESACREKAYVLEQTLNEFRLEVQVVAIETGPVITVFELKLAPGIKVSQIASLTNDMARALKAPAVRVVAPLPGKSTIGIEVPNIDKEKVRLRDVMEISGVRAENQGIPLYLGKDASGQPLVADLTRMPHLLIAGTTGSGKSVCITSLIMSVLLTRSPAQVQMVLIDPKVVELSMYKDVPHLMCPIVTEMSKAESILDWASTKMDERYELLAEAGVKDIRSYNRLGEEGLRERFQPASDEEMAQIPKRLPYIVIMIDELADLMMTSAKEVEFYLCRIAQKSRAVGIHLIVSTQRPQANVVTGLIKSNLPSRIAFRVSSRLDSRIVLDQNGGEVLMGQGDMLFLPPGQSKLVRAQGTFVDDAELRAVVKHCKEQHPQVFHPELVRMPGSGADGLTDRDEFFDQAVEVVVQAQRGSVSLLQRKLNVGYGRASRLIDQMYEAGIVGDHKGSQAREILVTEEEWQAIKAQRDSEEAAEQELEAE